MSNQFTKTTVQGNAVITEEYLPNGNVKVVVQITDERGLVGKFSAEVHEAALNLTMLNGKPFDLITDMIEKATDMLPAAE